MGSILPRFIFPACGGLNGLPAIIGNHADFVVLDRDFFTIPEAGIPRVRSVLTVIGGKIMHDAGVVRMRAH